MTRLYKLFYHPAINYIVRGALRPFRKILPTSFKIPISGTISIKTENNQKITFCVNETSPMAKFLFWEDRGCTFEFSNIFKHLVTSSKTFLDIGANVGYYSLLGKTLNPGLEVYACEPSKGPKYFLKKNVAINHLDSIHIIEKAVGSDTGVIDFYEDKNPKFPYIEYHTSGTSNTSNTWDFTAGHFLKYQVELTTINQICLDNNITQLDLIKIDTEGTEDLVFRGGIESIIQHQPIIICEVLENKIEHKIQDIIQNQFGYKIFQFQSKTNQLKLIESIAAEIHNGESNYFFVPAHKVSLIEPFIQKS